MTSCLLEPQSFQFQCNLYSPDISLRSRTSWDWEWPFGSASSFPVAKSKISNQPRTKRTSGDVCNGAHCFTVFLIIFAVFTNLILFPVWISWTSEEDAYWLMSKFKWLISWSVVLFSLFSSQSFFIAHKKTKILLSETFLVVKNIRHYE